MKSKLLCILHYTPPAHGASKVGDYIKESEKLKENFECRFIKIKSSNVVSDGGKVNMKKIYYVALLYFKILWNLIVFRPEKIYFTASIKKVAFYRDLLISTLWKCYAKVKEIEIFYHYHTKGIDNFVSLSKLHLRLTRFFLNDVNLILLSPLLEKDFGQVQSYKQIHFLPNGVEDPMENEDFETYIATKYDQVDTIEALYLAHMMKEKGYWEVLELAKKTKGQNIRYHFAGSWKDKESETDFFEFVKAHGLEEQVIYHGFVSGDEKVSLFKRVQLLLYPSKNDAFPLTLLEALSFGVPTIATDEGSIPYILDEKSGIILEDVNKLPQALDKAINDLINLDTSKYCRTRFLENFTLDIFENNLLNMLNNQKGDYK